jgi:hypothetical protein
MAALSQTPANVTLGSDAIVSTVVGGETITQGMPVYRDATSLKYYRADANVLAKSEAIGIAMTPCSMDGSYFVVVQRPGALVNLGATLTVGETYCVGATVGQVVPIGDLTSGDYPCILGTAVTTAFLETLFFYSGAMKP